MKLPHSATYYTLFLLSFAVLLSLIFKITSLLALSFWDTLKSLENTESQLLIEIIKVSISLLGTIATLIAGIAVYFNIKIAQRSANFTKQKFDQDNSLNQERLIRDS